MSFSNWREWKIWQWVGMFSFGILLAFLYTSNRKGFEETRDEIKDKFNKKEDALDQEQKNTEIKKVADNVSDITIAENKIHKTVTEYESMIKDEQNKGGTVDEKVDDFNDFMGKR